MFWIQRVLRKFIFPWTGVTKLSEHMKRCGDPILISWLSTIIVEPFCMYRVVAEFSLDNFKCTENAENNVDWQLAIYQTPRYCWRTQTAWLVCICTSKVFWQTSKLLKVNVSGTVGCSALIDTVELRIRSPKDRHTVLWHLRFQLLAIDKHGNRFKLSDLPYGRVRATVQPLFEHL